MVLVAVVFMALAFTHRNRGCTTMMLIANFTGITALIFIFILLALCAM